MFKCLFYGVFSKSTLLDTPTSSHDLEGQRSQPAERRDDPELTSWLTRYGADQDAIDRVGF